MRFLRNTSISRKLKVVILMTTSVALLVASAAFVAYDLIIFRQSMASDLSTLAKVIGTNCTAALVFNDRDSANDVLSALAAKTNIVRARIYSSDSELFAEYVRAGENSVFTLTDPQQSQIGFAHGYLIASETIGLDGENFGTVYLISNLDAFRSRLNQYFGVVSAVLFGSLLVAFLLSSKLQSLISDPISHLAKTARAVAGDKDYTIRAVKHGNDEMGELIDGFNEMLGQIQERDARLQTARDELELRVEERTSELKGEITERERIEQVLRRSEEHFRSLIENATDVITILDLDGTIRYESPAVERVMGYKPEGLIGRNANEFGHPEDQPAAAVLMPRVSEPGNDPAALEVRFKHQNGEWRTLEVVQRLIQDESGKTQIVVNSRDVTERKKAAETLKESETLFRSLAETVSAAIYIYRGSKFIYVNPAAESITGYTHDELMGMEVLDILHPESVEEAKKLTALRQTGEDVPTHTEVRILTKTGEVRWLDITPRLIRFQGEQAVLATAFDVTERKGWEDALRESEEKYRTILQSIQEGYYEVDLAGGLTFFNDSLSRIMGTPTAKMMGLKHRAYTDPETAKRVSEAFEEVFRTGEPLEGLQYEILTLEGLTKFLESSVLLRRDSTGKVVGFRGTSREITERKLAEEALRESEERYRALFEAASDAIMILDAQGSQAGRILAANRAAAETTGYTVEELLALNVSALRVPEQAANVPRDLQSVLDGFTKPVEVSRRRKDGTTFPIEVNASPVSLGDTRCILVFARDLTQRKQMEKEATMLAHTVRSIQECVSITDNEQHVLFVNDAFLKTYGFERHELLGKQLQDLVLVRDASEAATDERFGPGPEQAWEGELLNRRKDGTVFPINLRVSPIHDDSGRTIALAGIAQDITERKKIEKEVSMLAHTVRSIGESVCITDSKDDLLFVNDSFLTLYGYERNEVIGKNIFELVRVPANSPHATVAIPPPDLIQRWNGELFNRRKDGSEFPIHLSSSPILDETGRTIALVGVIQDITESKRAIEELQKAKNAAEAASYAKSEFLANMSHEIRTPMNGIIGMTELALDTELSPEQAEYLTLVKLSADSLLGVINDILDFSKIEAGKLELDFEDFNLQDCVDEVMKALSVRADQKGLELAYYLRPGVPDRITGDAGRLRQVLVNLVGNAIKFTELGEVILGIEAETRAGNEVFLHFGVRDTGIGVPIEKQKVIFESFTQADGSTTRKYGGTGLGLAISSQLVEMMGGKIWIESPVVIADEPIPGSLFHFTASFRVSRGSVQTEHVTYLSELAGLPVLVVDDNATNRRILEVQLTNWQMKSTGLEKPAAALALIREAAAAGTPFKLALLDFHMPEIDGLTLAEQIRNDPDGRDIRIIIMSSSVQQNQARHRNWSIDAKLVKPVKAAELLSMIRQVMMGDDRSTTQTRQVSRKSAYPGRVLLAEDNRVNQQLIKRLLEKWGHTAILAHNGKEALSMLEAEKFDCVLMDLQMPEINGFEATAIIRARERGTETHTPIIALTAHALKGDRQRCIDAGMDEYVSKPIEAAKLFDVIESVVNSRPVPEQNRRSTDYKPIDIDAIINHFDGDVDLLATLAAIFADSSAIQLSEIKAALTHGDAEALGRAAHSLKGSVSNFHAQVAVEAAATLEQMARSGDLARADSVFAVLQNQIEQLRKELETLEEVSLS